MDVRRRTAATITGCRKALEDSDWNVDDACLNIAKAMHEDRHDKDTHDSYGIVCPYTHAFGRIGSMVELSCESSYVAKHIDFIKLANTIAMHIAWAAPKGLDRGDVQQSFGDICLLDQVEMKETQGSKTIRELIAELSSKTGEKITLVQFARFEIGKPFSI